MATSYWQQRETITVRIAQLQRYLTEPSPRTRGHLPRLTLGERQTAQNQIQALQRALCALR